MRTLAPDPRRSEPPPLIPAQAGIQIQALGPRASGDERGRSDDSICLDRTLALVVFIWLLAPLPAWAHAGEPHGSGAAWTFDPFVVIPLLASAALYGAGAASLWRAAGLGRGIRAWQAACYAAGWLTLAGALVSPLHWLGEHLFTFHMIEHEIVMAVSAPLFVLARPIGAFLWALPKRVRVQVSGLLHGRSVRAAWRWMTHPRVATLAHGLAIWVWHAPALFDAAVRDVTMHRLQHLSFFVTALLFWWSMLRTADRGSAAWHIFVTMLHTSVLGALMALAPRVLYQAQTLQAPAWGLTPLEDQQLAGVVMWVPAGTIYAGAALAFIALWIKDSSARLERDPL
jgi:cytochrome c oxidase assembly factor CtaG